MEIRKVAVVGVGAVGAVLASKLSDFLGKENVQCIADGERLERYRRDGIFLNGKKLDLTFVASADADEAGLVIIATKNGQLGEAIPMVRRAVGRNTMILSVLNGIQSEREIADAYGKGRVLYGFVISLNSIHEGRNIECTDFGTVVFGEEDNARTERTDALSHLLENSGMRFSNPADIHLAQWRKFLINTVFNTISALTRSPYGAFRFEPQRNLARAAGKEVVAVANAEGIALSESMVEDAIEMMCGHDPHGKTSMLQDMEAGRKSENGWFCGTIARLARRHGIPTPLCDFLWNLVEASELARTI